MSLKYCLDRTQNLRRGENFSFVAIKEGFTGDNSIAAIPSWLKQTILLAHDKSDFDFQQLCQVKAHDVCLMSASLAFKSHVSVHEFWMRVTRNHNILPFSVSGPLLVRGQILKLVLTLCYLISLW